MTSHCSRVIVKGSGPSIQKLLGFAIYSLLAISRAFFQGNLMKTALSIRERLNLCRMSVQFLACLTVFFLKMRPKIASYSFLHINYNHS